MYDATLLRGSGPKNNMFTELSKRRVQEIPGVNIAEGRCAVGIEPSKLPMLMIDGEIEAMGYFEIDQFVNKVLLEIQQREDERKQREAAKRMAIAQRMHH